MPIEVSLTDEVALTSSAPVVSRDAPAAKLSPVEAPVEPDTAAAPPSDPAPVKPQPTPPKPAPAPDASERRRPDKPAAKPADTRPQQPRRDPRPSGALDGLMNGITDKPSKGKATNPPAAVSGPVRAALLNQLRLMLKPNWKAPTGSDADKLKTWVRITLRRDGTVANVEFLRQEGRTELNRTQWDLHQERAIAAVRKTRFDTTILKDDYFSVWGKFDTYFDKRL